MSVCQANAERLTGEENHCLHDKDDGGLVCCWCGDLFVSGFDHHGEYEPVHRLLAENADLRARLKAVRGPHPRGYLDEAEAWERILRITDLRVKRWRK